MEKASKPEQTCLKKGLSQFLVEEKGQPRRLLISMEGLPKFLVDANAAVETGRIAEATDILNDQAIETVRQMLEKNPSRIDVMLLVAIMLGKTGQLKEAEQWYKKLLEVEPHALVLNELACIYHSTGRLSMAMEYRAKALAAAPDNPGILGNFAVDLMLMGKMQDGIDVLRKLVEEDRDNVIAHSNLLWYMNYLPSTDPQVLFDEHRRWG
ncbi:MAG: hypothetical protein PVJ86_12725, partial [Phycisphaerales bacterium]